LPLACPHRASTILPFFVRKKTLKLFVHFVNPITEIIPNFRTEKQMRSLQADFQYVVDGNPCVGAG